MASSKKFIDGLQILIFQNAGQPEILRAVQKDDEFQNELHSKLSELLLEVTGVQNWIKYREMLQMSSGILYQALTTMSNLQTLGEEYTGIVQVGSSFRSLPPKYLQALMIVINCCGGSVFNSLCNHVAKHIASTPSLTEHAQADIKKAIEILRLAAPSLLKLHTSIFYITGRYHSLAKRLTAIQYVLVRYWLKDRSSLQGFRILGYVTLLHLLIYLVRSLNQWQKRIQVEQSYLEDTSIQCIDSECESADKCPLCLQKRTATSVISCGHVFCWSCIIKWLQEQPKCPMCRVTSHPSRVVLLHNYQVQ